MSVKYLKLSKSNVHAGLHFKLQTNIKLSLLNVSAVIHHREKLETFQSVKAYHHTYFVLVMSLSLSCCYKLSQDFRTSNYFTHSNLKILPFAIL